MPVDWAGRWIAQRAIDLGWTQDLFGAFESRDDLRRGREGHKNERFGKKYQWIAHRELLARLADNYHPAYHEWNLSDEYQGPWYSYVRDFDPSLPPSVIESGSRVCRLTTDESAAWAILRKPNLDVAMAAREWVQLECDLPAAIDLVVAMDPEGTQWIALQRFSSWDRDNATRRGMTQRERDVFFLQFSWLVPRGKGAAVRDQLASVRLKGRWMPEAKRVQQQYLGEGASSPIVATSLQDLDVDDMPAQVQGLGIAPRPATEEYSWEGSSLDCSLDRNVDCHAPVPELLGKARWIGHTAQWAMGGQPVARAIHVPDGENGQEVLVVEAEWLRTRLNDLDSDLVIGVLGERHARIDDESHHESWEFSDFTYLASMTPSSSLVEAVGPLLSVRGEFDEDETDGSP